MINITKEEYKKLLKIYKNQSKLANALNCSRYQIIQLNSKFNIDKIDIDELRFLYEDKNYNIEKLISHFNVSRTIITNKIKKYKLKNELKDRLITLYKDNNSINKIAKKINSILLR